MTNPSGSAVLVSAPERRMNPFRPELRTAEDGTGARHIWGYASMFNKLSRKLPGGFVERVDNRAFDASKANGFEGAVCRWNHNPDFILGSIAGRTCMIDVNSTGLLYDVVPPSFRSDIVELMERGDVVGSSFAFKMPEDVDGDDWRLSDYGLPLRTLLQVELVDVAPCSSTPAYPDATAALRSVDGAVHSLAHRFNADPVEIRSLLSNNQAVRLFKRTDQMFKPEVRDLETTSTGEEPEVSDFNEKRAALYQEEVRAKYSADQMKQMLSKGQAMKNEKGEPSYPIADEDDLHNAIHAVGRGGSSHDAIKAHIKKRAKAMGKTDMLPEDWKDGGSTEKNSADENAEERAAKASFADTSTCGDCGAAGQYGKHCTNCGSQMDPDDPMKGKFCANCGGKMNGKRSEHECDAEYRAAAKPKPDTTDDDDDDVPAKSSKKPMKSDEDDTGKGTETEGRADDEDDEDEEERAAKKPTKAPAKGKKPPVDDDEDDEDDDKPAKSGKGKLPGNDKSSKVGKGEDQLPPWLQKKRSMEIALAEKRYDPYFFDDVETSTEDEA